MSAHDPIQNIDQFDIVGRRNDGGMDLIVVVSAPLLDEERHRRLLQEKVEAYARAIGGPQFRPEFGISESSPVRILIISDHPVHESIREHVGSLAPIAESVGATLSIAASEQQWS
jgi:hypothetical protein